MSYKISRGKQQILYNYLPGKIFDFGNSVVAKIDQIRGEVSQILNKGLLITKVSEQAFAWREEFRPNLRNEILRDESKFVIINPRSASSNIYPLVFWCSNDSCKKVFDYTNANKVPSSKLCPTCKKGKLSQLRFIKVHICGNVEPLQPPLCSRCHSSEMALDDRKSERISNFKWRCLKCSHSQPIYRTKCRRCNLPNDSDLPDTFDIEVFRANRMYYVHTATLINIPQRKYDKFFNNPDWYVISAAKFLNHKALADCTLNEYANSIANSDQLNSNVSEAAFGDLLDKLRNGQLSVEEYANQIKRLQEQSNPSIEDLKRDIVEFSGVSEETWRKAKYNIIDGVIPFELGTVKTDKTHYEKLTELGVQSLSLIDNFPIIVASYGYSRVEYTPNKCQLNPFPLDREQGGKYPVFVDSVQADALLIKLDSNRVIRWIERNGYPAQLPGGNDSEAVTKGYFVQLFEQVNCYEKIFNSHPEARLVFSLLHTYSHFAIKQAALLCGLDKTSISEYLVPKTLSFSLYCNHRFGATIGALTALFEQSLDEWLDLIGKEKLCVYDPVCHSHEGNCHSCTHLAETSCKFFNLNLGRIYLFGGFDKELQREIIGYFDSSI
jgi:hypothetical protein